MPNGIDTSFQILHGPPARPIETVGRACLVGSDFPTRYASPEYFCEPTLHGQKPFAILSIVDDDVTPVMTPLHNADRVRSGFSTHLQIVFARHADRSRAMTNLIAGVLQERIRKPHRSFSLV